ncbi:MAG: hypothetical protein ACOY4K_00300 [Pseudomonadota bacterium]
MEKPPEKPDAEKAGREARLAQALRANLRRRKATRKAGDGISTKNPQDLAG